MYHGFKTQIKEKLFLPPTFVILNRYFYWLYILFSRPFYCVIHSLTQPYKNKIKKQVFEIAFLLLFVFLFSSLAFSIINSVVSDVFFSTTPTVYQYHTLFIIHGFVEISHNVCIMYLYIIKALFEQSYFEIHMSRPVQQLQCLKKNLNIWLPRLVTYFALYAFQPNHSSSLFERYLNLYGANVRYPVVKVCDRYKEKSNFFFNHVIFSGYRFHRNHKLRIFVILMLSATNHRI